MINYEKPAVLKSDDMAEGVFLASGGVNMISGAGVTGSLTSADHYGNYYFNVSGLENGATYRIVVTVNETGTINGLNAASWGGFGGVVSGNTVTFEGVCYSNQTDWHIRLWFDSQGNWENGWRLQDDDIPGLSINVTKIS